MDLTKGGVNRNIFYFAIPMLIGNVFQQMYAIIDSVFVGNFIGKQGLAVIGVSFPVIFVMVSLIIGIASGSTIIIAQYFGAKDFNNIRRAIDTMLICLLTISITISILGLIFAGNIFLLLKLPVELLPIAKLYLNIYIVGFVVMFCFNGVMAVMRGMGDSRTPLYFLILSTILNIIFDVILVAIFRFGLGAVALGTVLSQTITFITSIIYLNKKHDIINLSFRKYIFDRKIFKLTLKIGLPSGIQQTFVALGMMALMRLVNNFGTNVIAAYTVAGRIDSFASLPAMNFAIAISTFVGQNLGANKPERVRRAYRSTLLMMSAISVTVTIIVVLFGRQIISIFTSDVNVINAGVQYFYVVSPFYLLFSIMFISNGVLRGAGETLVPMIITILGLWIIRVPISWYLSHRMGVVGIWWGIPAAWFSGALFSTIYYFTGWWKKKVIVSPLLN